MRVSSLILALGLLLGGCKSVDVEGPSFRCDADQRDYHMSKALLLGYGAAVPYVIDSADFDGTNDYMTHTGFTGAANSKSGIFSAWIRLDGGNAAVQTLLFGGPSSSNILVLRDASNLFSIIGDNAAGTAILQLNTVATYVSGATWRHVLASWDLATAAGHLYINDVSDLAAPTLTNDTLDYTHNPWVLGANISAANKVNGCLADFYFAPGQYLDFSNAGNRRKFISATGKPVYLGPTGEVPTGISPAVYQHLDDAEAVANFATNRGDGGNWTIGGTLDTGSSSPSD